MMAPIMALRQRRIRGTRDAEAAKAAILEAAVREFTADFHRTLGIAVKSLKHLPPATKAFIEHAKTCAS